MSTAVFADLSHVGFELVASIPSVCSCAIYDNRRGVPGKQCKEEKMVVFLQHACAGRSKRTDEATSLKCFSVLRSPTDGPLTHGAIYRGVDECTAARKERGAKVLWRSGSKTGMRLAESCARFWVL